MAAKRKPGRPGTNIAEEARSTVAVKLRLKPDDADALEALAERWGIDRSKTVARLVRDASVDRRKK